MKFKNKKIQADGYITFRYTMRGIEIQYKNHDDILQQLGHEPGTDPIFEDNIKEKYPEQHLIADLLTGNDFLEMVDNNTIMDYDGTLSGIYVDGYLSNIGLSHNNFEQGNFLLDHDAFWDLCDTYRVIVNWASQ